MKSSLRAFLLGINASYWFLPSLLTLFALGLAVLTIELDRAGAGVFLERIDEWHPGAEAARSQLNAVATSMITVAATVFAITIAAVSFASGHYGPRVLANFMRDRGNQFSLGVFIVFIDALAGVARGAATEHRRQSVLKEGRTFFAQVETELKGPALQEMRERLARFEAELAGTSDRPSSV
jgi:uncharacterized membrane protein